MASVVTTEEIRALKARLESTRERVKGNKKEAIRVLQAAGIATQEGKLTPRYVATQDE